MLPAIPGAVPGAWLNPPCVNRRLAPNATRSKSHHPRRISRSHSTKGIPMSQTVTLKGNPIPASTAISRHVGTWRRAHRP